MTTMSSDILMRVGLLLASFAGVLAAAEADLNGPFFILVLGSVAFSASVVMATRQKTDRG